MNRASCCHLQPIPANTMSPPNTNYGKRLQECSVEMIESLVIEEAIDTPLVHIMCGQNTPGQVSG